MGDVQVVNNYRRDEASLNLKEKNYTDQHNRQDFPMCPSLSSDTAHRIHKTHCKQKRLFLLSLRCSLKSLLNASERQCSQMTSAELYGMT